jgi:hypothetical protein
MASIEGEPRSAALHYDLTQRVIRYAGGESNQQVWPHGDIRIASDV